MVRNQQKIVYLQHNQKWYSSSENVSISLF